MYKFAKKVANHEGFTLVELIVVIAILGILAGIAIPVYSGYIKKAGEAADNTLLSAVNTAYAAACMENGEFDMKTLAFTPSALVTDSGVTMSKYNDEFQRYFAGNGSFKYYDVLTFVKNEGVFKGTTGEALTGAMQASWGNSSFSSEDGSQEKDLLAMFDEIEAVFGRNAGLLSILVEGTADNPMMSALVSDLGLDGLNAALNLTDDQLKAVVAAKLAKDPSFIEGYAGMTDEQKAAAIESKALELAQVIKGNSAVLHVAADATGHTTADIQNSLGSMMGMMQAMSSNMTDEQFNAYVAENTPGYETMTEEQKTNAAAAIRAQLSETALSLGGVTITNEGMLLAQQAMAADTSLGDGGVSTMGALFALTQGFYSDPANYTGDKPAMNGGTNMLKAVFAALQDEKFGAYYSAKGAADITAYLDAMSVMASQAGSIDMTSNKAFADQYDYIAEILGITTP